MTDTTPAAGASAPARNVDLDAKRRQRLDEAKGVAPTLTFDGKEHVLPPELPADFALLTAEQDLRGAINQFDFAEAFWASKPSWPDVEELLDAIASLYGVEQGKSQQLAR